MMEFRGIEFRGVIEVIGREIDLFRNIIGALARCNNAIAFISFSWLFFRAVPSFSFNEYCTDRRNSIEKYCHYNTDFTAQLAKV